jgi:NodT family efflux transporter outer membrane factor (OMF) lipoprotein
MRRIALSLATAAAALAAAACAPRVSVPPPRIGTPPVFEAPSVDTVGAIDLDRWWLGFGDPQLTALIEQALSNSADARLAMARLEEAQAVRAGALSRFGLQGDLQANATTQRQTVLSGTGGPIAGQPGQAPGQPGAPGGAAPFIGGNITTLAPNLNLSWEADLFGRRAATRSGADADLIAARFVYEGARAALAADVADALFVARGLVRQLADGREAVRIQRELRGVLHARATRGLTADAEVARVDADLRHAEARAEALDAELTAAKRILLVLTGADQARTGDIIISETIAEAPRVPASLPGDLLRRRPDIREAEARFRSAVATAEVRRLDLFPRLTLNPGAGITQISGDFDLSIITWTLAGGLALPLLDRRRLLTELRAQTARADQAAATYEKTVQTAFSEADQALVRLSADRRRVTLLEEGTVRANTAFIAQRTLFDRGLSDLQQLLDAERIWRSAREAETSARTDTLRRSVTSFKALGGGWPSASPSQESPTR